MKYLDGVIEHIFNIIYGLWDNYQPTKFDCLIFDSKIKKDIDVIYIRLKNEKGEELSRLKIYSPKLKIPKGTVCERLSEEIPINPPYKGDISKGKLILSEPQFTYPYILLGMEEPRTTYSALERDIINLDSIKIKPKDTYKDKVLKGFVKVLPGNKTTRLDKRLLAFSIAQEWNYSFNPNKVELKITDTEVYLVTDVIPIRLEFNSLTKRLLELIGNRISPITVTKKDNLSRAKMCFREIAPFYDELMSKV